MELKTWENSKETLDNMIANVEKANHKLLYLTKYGSHLYGTSTENSDTDFKGIFLPNKQDCLLGKVCKHFTFSTGESESKNNKDDIDVQLWSLQYWMTLVNKGETNSLNLLYSFTYPEMIFYMDSRMKNIFENHNKLYTTNDCNAHVGYAKGNMKKYSHMEKLNLTCELRDFKSLSHVLRVVDEMIMLLKDGMIQYPLHSAKKLLDVKKGKYTWKEIESMVFDGLKKVDDLRIKGKSLNKLDRSFIDKEILKFY